MSFSEIQYTHTFRQEELDMMARNTYNALRSQVDCSDSARRICLDAAIIAVLRLRILA